MAFEIIIWSTNVLLCLYGMVRSKSVFILYWFVALSIGVPILYDYLANLYDHMVIQQANLYVLFFNALFLVVQLAFFEKEETAALSIDRIELHKYAKICSFIAPLSILLIFFIMPSGDMMGMDWDEIAVEMSGWKTLLLNIALPLIIVSSSLLLPAFIARRDRLRVMVILVSCLTVVVIFRNKAMASIFVLPAMVYTAIKSRQMHWMSYLSRIFGVVLIFLSIYILIGTIRWMGPLREAASMGLFPKFIEYLQKNPPEHELRETYYTVMKYFQSESSLQGATYTRMILFPFKWFLEGDIPDNPMYLYSDITGNNTKLLRASNHPTVYGDSYANFGICGLLVAPLLATFIGLLWRFANRSHFLFIWVLLSVMSFGMPLLLRGSVYYGFYHIVVGMSVASFIYILTGPHVDRSWVPVTGTTEDENIVAVKGG